MSDWPDGPTPIVEEIQVAQVIVEGRPVALVRLSDALGNIREIQLSERASWAAMVGFTHFLRQTHQPPRQAYEPSSSSTLLP